MNDTRLFVGAHADILASGRTLVPGEEFPASALTPDDPHDQRLQDEGLIIEPAPEEQLAGEALHARAAELEIEGRSDMTAAQLRRAVTKAEREQAAQSTTDEEA